MNNERKVAVITGASQGIGAGIVKGLSNAVSTSLPIPGR